MISTEGDAGTATITVPSSVDPPAGLSAPGAHPHPGARRGRTLAALVGFDPTEIARLEAAAWVAYYRRRWRDFALCGLRCAHDRFGLSWIDTLRCAWLVTRANQRWAPLTDNDAAGAQAGMRRVYALLAHRYGVPVDPAAAAARDIAWWQIHRELQLGARRDGEALSAFIAFWQQVYPVSAAALAPAAEERRLAMLLSDRWIVEGCRPDSRLLPEIRAALTASYDHLLRAVADAPLPGA